MDIVKLPISDFGEAKVSLVAGKVVIELDVDLLSVAKDVRAKSTNAIENAVLDAIIGALAPAAPPAV